MNTATQEQEFSKAFMEATEKVKPISDRWAQEADGLMQQGIPETAVLLATLMQLSRAVLAATPLAQFMRGACIRVLMLPGTSWQDAVNELNREPS